MPYKFLTFILLVTCFSCGKSGDHSASSVEIFNYHVDSVVVDAIGHIFDLKYSLLKSDYCEENGFLYTYNIPAYGNFRL